MTPDETSQLSDLVELRNIDDLWTAVRFCAELARRETEPAPFATIQAILQEIGTTWESEPVSAEAFDRVTAELVPEMRRLIAAPSAEAAAALFRVWTRLKQEHPLVPPYRPMQ